MSYRFGKLWHLAIIWAIRKAFQCILQDVRFLLANHTRLSPTSENDSYINCCLMHDSIVDPTCRATTPLASEGSCVQLRQKPNVNRSTSTGFNATDTTMVIAITRSGRLLLPTKILGNWLKVIYSYCCHFIYSKHEFLIYILFNLQPMYWSTHSSESPSR